MAIPLVVPVIRPALPELTLQVICRGDALELEQTLHSLELAVETSGLVVEVQLISEQLSAVGAMRCTSLCSQPTALPVQWLQHSSAAEGSRQARGRWIWPLEHGDRLLPNSLQRWQNVRMEHHEALVIAGDGEHLGRDGAVLRQHGALPSSTRLRQLVQAQLYCPAALSWRKSLLALRLDLNARETRCGREAWLVQLLESCAQRFVVVPERWAQTHQLSDWQQPGRCRHRALAFSPWLAQRWGSAPAGELHRYGLQLQLGEAEIPPGSSALAELASALRSAEPWLTAEALQQLRNGWSLNEALQPWQQRLEEALASSGFAELWCVTLLRNLLHPELGALQLGSPWGPQIRLAERLLSSDLWSSYTLLRQDAELVTALNQRIGGIPLVALLHWIRQPSWQQHFPLPARADAYRRWWQQHAALECPNQRWTPEGCLEAEPFSEEPAAEPSDRPFGVNLIGHAFEVFGIGEDVRMAALALKSAEVPFCVVNVPARNGAAAADRSLEQHTLRPGELGPYQFNLVCLSAPSHGSWIAREGLAQQRGRCTIVAWPWETETWPKAWECLIPLADALWPASTFTARALMRFSDPMRRPLQVMPMAVHIENPQHYRSAEQRRHTRERWGLDAQAKLVLFVFDVKSSLARKNPWGALQAFEQAFDAGNSGRVQLVIKALQPARAHAEWDRLQQRVGRNPRLKLIADDLSRHELLALMGCCDVFLSLHRSEGFGRGIAEAGLLGLQVVTSAWGGNVDFCQGETFHLVPCAAREIQATEYDYAAGHKWGEPDVFTAIEKLRKALRKTTHPTDHKNPILQELTVGAAGQRYTQALQHLKQTQRSPAE